RIVSHFFEHAFVVNARCFGAATDQRKCRPDQHVMRAHLRIGHFLHNDVLDALANNLFHDGFAVKRDTLYSTLTQALCVVKEPLNNHARDRSSTGSPLARTRRVRSAERTCVITTWLAQPSNSSTSPANDRPMCGMAVKRNSRLVP